MGSPARTAQRATARLWGMRHLSLLATLTLLIAPGCFVSRDRVNTPLDPARVGALKPRESTADDVLAALGAPSEVIQLGRRSAWRYDHAEGKTAAFTLILVTFVNKDVKQDRMWAFFDEEDVLTHFGSTYEADEASYKMPWQD